MSLDDIEAQAAALESEVEKPSAQSPEIQIVALAEAVARINRSTELTNKETREAARIVAEAPEKFQKAVTAGFQDSLKELNEKEQRLVRRSIVLKKSAFFWSLIIGFLAVLIFTMLAAASRFWFVPEIARYLEYRDTHQVIEEGSLFGAQLREQDGVQYIVFDEGTKVQVCSEPKHCISISRQ